MQALPLSPVAHVGCGSGAVFLMLNPSTADAIDNDPTVERCLRRALKMGFGGLMVCNTFAYRSTDPEKLYEVEDPVGPENDQIILARARSAGMVICGWGTHGALHGGMGAGAAASARGRREAPRAAHQRRRFAAASAVCRIRNRAEGNGAFVADGRLMRQSWHDSVFVSTRS